MSLNIKIEMYILDIKFETEIGHYRSQETKDYLFLVSTLFPSQNAFLTLQLDERKQAAPICARCAWNARAAREARAEGPHTLQTFSVRNLRLFWLINYIAAKKISFKTIPFFNRKRLQAMAFFLH